MSSLYFDSSAHVGWFFFDTADWHDSCISRTWENGVWDTRFWFQRAYPRRRHRKIKATFNVSRRGASYDPHLILAGKVTQQDPSVVELHHCETFFVSLGVAQHIGVLKFGIFSKRQLDQVKLDDKPSYESLVSIARSSLRFSYQVLPNPKSILRRCYMPRSSSLQLTRSDNGGTLAVLDGTAARASGLKSLDDVKRLLVSDLAEDDVASVEPRGDNGGDEELGAVAVEALELWLINRIF